MDVYLVMWEFYEEPHIEKAFLSKQKATEYAEKQKVRFDSQSGWYVEELEVEK